jgi:hypothetical protein
MDWMAKRRDVSGKEKRDGWLRQGRWVAKRRERWMARCGWLREERRETRGGWIREERWVAKKERDGWLREERRLAKRREMGG